MPGRPAFGHKIHLAQPSSGGATNGLFDAEFGLARICQTVVNGLQNSSSDFGHALPNKVGAGAAIVTFSDATGVYIQYTCTTGAASLAGWVVNTTIDSFRFDDLPTYVFHFQTGGTVANVRYWIGFIPSGQGAQTVATPNNFVVFRYNTPASSDTTWQTVTVDGAGNSIVNDTGVSVVADTSYYMAVQVFSSSEVRFYLNQSNTLPSALTLVATHTGANMPAAATVLGPTMHLNNGTSGATRAIRVGYMRGRHL